MSEDTEMRTFSGRNISDVLSKNDFEDIVKFVLKNGDRQTYCNMYNNNPHYVFGGFHIYLNPISQMINYTEDCLSDRVDDYQGIMIDDPRSRCWYYDIILYRDEVLINYRRDKGNIEYEETIISKYIPKLKEMIGKRDAR